MRSTRKIVADFVGVFLIGALAGGLVTWSYTDTQLSSFMTKAADKPDAMVVRINKKYTDDYHLSPDELDRIQPLIKDMAQHIYQVRHQFGADMVQTLDSYHTQIAAQLTAEHRAIYEAAMAERKKKLSALLLLDPSSPNPGSP
ncbi:MAG TPA: hypothetical protein VGC39_04480 [Candidatus Methylacidiphilales bacterium]